MKVDPGQYGLYEGEVKLFLQYFEDMERVKQLGRPARHRLGTPRSAPHRQPAARPAARQGDPGSSRFYLSLEDDLMRLFGGDQVSGLMQRLKVDDTLPLEARVVSGIIENSQHRVEGANFDVRKHLLEYDDVLNKQREQIYSQRDRIFTKQDLTEDVADMLADRGRIPRPGCPGGRGRALEADRLAGRGPTALRIARPADSHIRPLSCSRRSEQEP